jgi:hypothetical protein
METGQQPARSWISDAIIIAAIGASTSLLAFFYEIGYCDYFNIPRQFISINTTIISTVIGLLGFIIVPSVFLRFIPTEIAVLDFPRGFRITLFVTYLLGGLSMLYISGIHEPENFVPIACLAVFAALFWFVIFLTGSTQQDIPDREFAKFTAELKAIEKSRASRSGIIRSGIIRYERPIMIGLAILCVGAVFLRTMARTDAKNQKVFRVVSQYSENEPEFLLPVFNHSAKEDRVILRIYSDYLITAPFNRSTKVIDKKLYILKMSDMSKIPLTTEEVGPLSLKP